jgi:hypothetical protein
MLFQLQVSRKIVGDGNMAVWMWVVVSCIEIAPHHSPRDTKGYNQKHFLRRLGFSEMRRPVIW